MEQAVEQSNTNENIKTIFGAPEGQDARILAEKARSLEASDGVLVHVALDDTRCAELLDLLKFFAPDVRVVEFPAWDCLPYDRVSPNNEVVAKRVAALSTLLAWEAEAVRYPRIVLTTVNAVLQRVMPRTALDGASLSAKVGGRLDLPNLQKFLAHNGYNRSETVREAGEYAIRGGIVDLYPPGYENPLRIDLFGDEIETIREFDPLSQRSAEKVKEFSLQPAAEIFLNDDTIGRFRSGYRAAFGVVRDDDPLYAAVSEGRRHAGMEHWMPLFYERLDTMFDYIAKPSLTMDHTGSQSLVERGEQIADFFDARKTLQEAAGRNAKGKAKSQDVSLSGSVYHPLPITSLYLNDVEWGVRASEIEELSPFGGTDENAEHTEAKKGRDFTDIRSLPDGDVFAELKKHIVSFDIPVFIAAYSEGAKERLKTLMESAGINTLQECSTYRKVKRLDPGAVGVGVLTLEHGFVSADLVVLTEQDILGDRLARKSKKRKKADQFLREVSSLSEGDLVVHIEHGVGRFLKLETLEAAGKLHDCLKIEYAGGDRLFVPVENIEVLSRFGGDTGALDKMGGAGWQARKASVKKDLMIMAGQLLDIAAARKLRRTAPLEIGADLYGEFAARFAYAETEDQLRAIGDVLADLGGDHPMDRLICGDVGFGKTEVALRAAYVAAMSGVQVAVVVPTTLLSRQHYQNFMARFAGTGLRIGQLSRMVTGREAQLTKDGMADGSVNIVIGTHALFAKGLKFKEIGLIIVDEEQRFGVKQKERLKEIKANVHVLTLSATPIPRTLQMSLAGVKEMSLIATPPVDRLAIRSFVLPFDPVVVREALLREHHRGGQSFYVCPRVKDMADLEAMLKELVPEVKVIAAHGQLTPTELEDRMDAFYERKYDVLLATNIIESGIDIPSANTMIVHRADMFGLSQLYQIRGRIGRSKIRAYAYLTYQPKMKLNDNALKRLEVMESLDSLGAGFQLASHDMDIRGAGNLLGEQQSGHIREVGVELYQQMLEEAVAAAREGTDLDEIEDTRWSPQVNVGTSVLIPDTYIEDLNIRMSLYRRISELEEKDEIDGFAAEMIDRFGKIPQEVENLLNIVAIKQLCRKAGVARIDGGPKGAVIAFHNDAPPNVGALMAWLQEKGGSIKIRPDQKIVITRAWENADHRVKGVQRLMAELAKLS